MSEKGVNRKELEFLIHSNWIEKEYSKIAKDDSILAWKEAKKYKDTKMNTDYVLMVHKTLMKNIYPEIAGKIRKVPVYIGRKECLKPSLIKEELNGWTKEYSQPKSASKIKKAHIQFERIHPFEDGNGRVGRILMNIQRLNADLPLIIIHEGKEQMEYYDWFRPNNY